MPYTRVQRNFPPSAEKTGLGGNQIERETQEKTARYVRYIAGYTQYTLQTVTGLIKGLMSGFSAELRRT